MVAYAGKNPSVHGGRGGWESTTSSHDPDEVFHWSRAMPEHPPLAVKPWRHQGQLASPGAGTRLDNAGPAKHGTVETFKLNISSGGTSWQPNKDESCEHGGPCYKAWHRVAHSWFLTFVRQPIPNYWCLLKFYKKYSWVRPMRLKYILCPSSLSQNMGLSKNMRFVFVTYA